MLLRLYNDEQHYLFQQLGLNETVKCVRIPPMFYSSYMHDWEWTHTDNSSGQVWQIFSFYDSTQVVHTYRWEAQQQAELDVSETEAGHHFTHPWEAYIGITTPEDIPPLHATTGFHKMIFIAYDREPIEPTTKKEISKDDPSWRSRTGGLSYYYRDEKLSDFIMPYPIPSSGDVEWQDTASGEADPDTAQYGSTTLDVDYNLLMVFEKEPTELSATTDESEFAEFLQKYIEYGVLERAYAANTDGNIESLSNYWAERKKLGYKAIKLFKARRMVDRDYCLKTKDTPAKSTRRHPRLPDAYPAMM